jgi:hypothetical protein
MWEQLRKLADELQLSQGQLLQIAAEITGNRAMRTTDLLTRDERRVLIAELERLRDEAAVLVWLLRSLFYRPVLILPFPISTYGIWKETRVFTMDHIQLWRIRRVNDGAAIGTEARAPKFGAWKGMTADALPLP